MKIKGLLVLLSALLVFFSWRSSTNAGTKNSGLGPLEIRPQFLVNQQFLAMSPGNTLTLKDGESKLSFNIEIANTFVNTQGPTEQITKKEVARGLTLADFLDKDGKQSLDSVCIWTQKASVKSLNTATEYRIH